MAVALDILDRVALIRDAARARVESDRERNRRDMPEATRIMDELIAVFGKPQHMRWQEAGLDVRWGKPIAYAVAVPASVHPVPAKPIRGRK